MYDDYLRYRNIDDLLERAYVARNPSRRRSAIAVPPALGRETEQWSYPPEFTSLLHQRLPQTRERAAFVLMAIDRTKPEIEDAYNAIKNACRSFGISAYRADEIEHQDRITDRVLQEIVTCEFLIADLTYERPNVYYEVGYAHAYNKKPILYRRTGTRLHFDLSVHNVPEYRNATELGKALTRSLATILGREPRKVS